jgi:homoserine O-acetyltransferase
MDWFDVAEYGGGDVMKGLASIKVERALAIGVHTDILFPLQQQEQVADGLRAGGAEAEFLDLPSPQGHDAFLVDIARFGPAIAGFLARL